MAKRGRKARPLAERFWEKVIDGGPDDCWLWTAAKARGYGHIKDGNGRFVASHRVAWELAAGRPVPDGLVVMHSCDEPLCCNPRHLSADTQSANMADRSIKGRAATIGRKGTCKKHGDEIATLFVAGRNRTQLARLFGVDRKTVRNILQKRGLK